MEFKVGDRVTHVALEAVIEGVIIDIGKTLSGDSLLFIELDVAYQGSKDIWVPLACCREGSSPWVARAKLKWENRNVTTT